MELSSICLSCFSIKGNYEVCPYCGYIEGTLPKEPYLLYPGTILTGRYIIGTVLGIGGFGVTYKAWDMKLSIIVAIKEFYPGGLVNRIPGTNDVMLFSGEKQRNFTQLMERFLDEARNMAKFAGDKNIINVFDFFEENNTAYIVMEFLEGMNLKEYLTAKGGLLSQDEVVLIASGILNAIKNIHAKGIIHRDISPDNIVIGKDGRVKILDFGAARFDNKEDQQFTSSIVIKIGYAPPEQYRSNMKQGIWTDIYAIGATIYKMLTGITPDESIDRMEKDMLKRPSKLGVKLDTAVEKTIMKAMALKPELRFKSIDSMLAALENRVSIDFPEEELRKRKRIRVAFILLAIISLLGMGSYIGYESTRVKAVTLADLDISAGSITINVPSYYRLTEAYEHLAKYFGTLYPDYHIAVMEDQESSTLFLSSEMERSKGDMTMLIDSLDKDKFWFFNQYESYYSDKTCIPIGFNFKVCFGNQIIFHEHGIGIPSEITSDEQIEDLYNRVGETGMLFDWGTSLRSVQDIWSGYYEVIPFTPKGRIEGYLAEEWCVDKEASENDKNIAMLFLHFLLSDYAQNYLHVQQDAYLPINKAALEQYLSINQDYSFLSKKMKNIHIIQEDNAS